MRQPVQFEAKGFSERERAEEHRGRARDANNLAELQQFFRVPVLGDQHIPQQEVDQSVAEVTNHHPEKEWVSQEQQH